jgi:hypothetical protein
MEEPRAFENGGRENHEFNVRRFVGYARFPTIARIHRTLAGTETCLLRTARWRVGFIDANRAFCTALK